MDGGEFIAYTFGIFYPSNAPRLTDVQAQLSVSGPAASKVTILDPTVHLGTLEPGTLTAPVFTIYIDPSIDAPALRMTDNAFNLSITSTVDGFTVPQVLTHNHLLQADDSIVSESGCWNFESGDQGFVSGPIFNSYTCVAADCGILRQIDTVPAPWTHGSGCGSETRTDDAGLACDAGGTSAFKTNATPATCGNFVQTANTLVDSALYSPIFVPAHTGLATNGQPWYYRWLDAQWYYRSDMVSLVDPALAVGLMWDPNYAGTDVPGVNEVYEFYPYFLGYFTYLNQSWDSATPWHPRQPPANLDSIGFSNSAGGLATAGLKWRWAVEVFDADYGGDPLETPATAGLTLDNLSLAYEQYHAAGQTGSCADPAAVVSFDQYSYVECPADALAIHVLDGNAAGPVRMTVTSDATGDSETLTIQGTAPRFTGTLPYSTAAGPRANDGTLFVMPADLVRVTYADGSGVPPEAQASIACPGGNVVTEGLAGLTDNGDGDTFADANETVNIAIRIRNNTAEALHNVVVTLDSDDPTVDCISKSTASFGTIASGAAATNNLLSDPFTFKVSGSAACTDPATPPSATFQVLILADGFAGPLEPQEVTLLLDMNDVGGTVTYLADFSAGPSGFVHQLGPGDDNGAAADPNGLTCSPYTDEFFWRGTGGNPGGGYFCWQDPADQFPNGNYGDLSDSALYSRVLKIGANTTTLSFDHEYLFAWTGSLRIDGARVDYRVNGGAWSKLTTLPYDGSLIYNTYCNPLCNGTELAQPCFSEVASDGELIFNQLAQGPIPWRSVSGVLGGLTPGDLVQFRWRVGSMNTSAYGVSTQGGYGLDNVRATNVVPQVCDTAVRPDTGCGVVFDGFGNLVQICGDDDTLVEPTETWSVDVTLRNSGATSAPSTVADLVVNGSSVPATVSGNPGAFGTLAGNGGTGTAQYEFVVGAQATCVDELLFDVTNIAAGQATHPDQPSAFAIPVGGIGLQQNASQSVDPLLAANRKKLSALAPALTAPAPAHRVTLDYAKSYINPSPLQTEHQTVDPLVTENTSVSTTLGAPFTVNPDDAVSAVVDWTSLNHPTLTSCVRVFLQTPTGAPVTLKAIGVAAANPYDILNIYKNLNGGSGQYRIGIEEVASGPCKQQASLSGATMSVSKQAPTANWAANARVSLWDGTTEHVIKEFGAADAAPYDVTAIYNAAGPGNYELLLEESGAGGEAGVFGAVLNVTGVECDAPCASSLPAPPVVGLRLARGASPNEIQVTIDNATCSSSRAVVVYGNLGDFTHYQGAVGGCDIGTGPTATITHAGNNVWFNVLWVDEDGTAGHPGFGTSGPRSWNAAGLCSVVDDDRSDPVCD